jgi:hypothetical protein
MTAPSSVKLLVVLWPNKLAGPGVHNGFVSPQIERGVGPTISLLSSSMLVNAGWCLTTRRGRGLSGHCEDISDRKRADKMIVWLHCTRIDVAWPRACSRWRLPEVLDALFAAECLGIF